MGFKSCWSRISKVFVVMLTTLSLRLCRVHDHVLFLSSKGITLQGSTCAHLLGTLNIGMKVSVIIAYLSSCFISTVRLSLTKRLTVHVKQCFL